MSSRGPLSFYRSILRAARALPSTNRRAFVRRRARDEFEAGRSAVGDQVDLLLRYADISVDNIEAQALHLREKALFKPEVKV